MFRGLDNPNFLYRNDNFANNNTVKSTPVKSILKKSIIPISPKKTILNLAHDIRKKLVPKTPTRILRKNVNSVESYIESFFRK